MFPQSFCEIGVDSAVLFLTADRKGENFWLGEIVEGLHGVNPFRRVLRILLNSSLPPPVKAVRTNR
jgi:hypothetical protein